jgi:hypothetical protein
MAEDLIRYDLLAQNALRGVIRQVLLKVLEEGLPGEHHFFVAFETNAPGVRISPRLKAQYPDEMTIVLQHQFWDLRVDDDRFSIKLSFDNVPETLVVPFAAIKGFFDPSVQFGLQFDVADADAKDGSTDDSASAGPSVPTLVPENDGAVALAASGNAAANSPDEAKRPASKTAKGTKASRDKASGDKDTGDKRTGDKRTGDNDTGAEQAAKAAPAPIAEADEAPQAEVVVLDAFRKKT